MSGQPTFASVVIASNRGPISFSFDDAGNLVPSRGAGGVVTALTGALRDGGTWIAAAMSDADRAATAKYPQGRIPAEDAAYSLRYMDLSPEDYDGYYNYVSNGMLWFANHYLWDNTTSPVWDDRTEEAWTSYVNVNRAFARTLAEEAESLPGPTALLIQDYHLSLVPRMLRDLVPDALISHFTHTPFSGPTYIRAIPTHMRRELLTGMLGADVLGFHSEAWAENFLMSARYIPWTRVELNRYRAFTDGQATVARVHPLSVDATAIRQTASTPEAAEKRRQLQEWRGDSKLILRVDRFELSKNILRGFSAYGLFLNRHPEWKERVRFLAILSPSRTELPEYRTYADQCLEEAARVNEEHGTPSWQPIEVRVKDDYVGAVAAYSSYDVLMVNPVIDGLNLVSMEGPVANRVHGVLVLSRNAGSYFRLGKYAMGVNPHDLGEQADAIHTALTMDEEEKTVRARGLSRLVRSNPPSRWVTQQLRDLEKVKAKRAWYEA